MLQLAHYFHYFWFTRAKHVCAHVLRHPCKFQKHDWVHWKMLRCLDKKLYIFPSLWFSLLLALAGAFDTIHAFGAEKKTNVWEVPRRLWWFIGSNALWKCEEKNATTRSAAISPVVLVLNVLHTQIYNGACLSGLVYVLGLRLPSFALIRARLPPAHCGLDESATNSNLMQG